MYFSCFLTSISMISLFCSFVKILNRLLEQLVTEKNPRAFNILSQMYDHILPSKINKSKVSEINSRGAELGDVFCWIETGREFSQMKKLLHKLVSKGNKTAMAYLGYLYEVSGDFESAIKYFEMGANKNDIICCDFLFGMYRTDTNSLPENWHSLCNNEKAIYYGKKGALLGHASTANQMGNIYVNGDIVPEDFSKAMPFYEIAAEHGVPAAQYALAICYENVQKDFAKAVYWFEKAIISDPDNSDAIFELGYLYDKGLGTSQNYERAFELYQKAANAKKPVVNAMNNFGFLYQTGQGVAQDYALALYWYEKAATNGMEIAKENAKFIRNEMSRNNIDTSPADELRRKQKGTGDELRSELSSITDELRASGFFNITGN